MATVTVTEKMVLDFVLNFIDPIDWPAGMMEKAQAMLDKKTTRKESKAQIAKREADEALKGAIVEFFMENPDKQVRAGEIPKLVEACADISTSKATALLKALVVEGAVTRLEEKGVALYEFVD